MMSIYMAGPLSFTKENITSLDEDDSDLERSALETCTPTSFDG